MSGAAAGLTLGIGTGHWLSLALWDDAGLIASEDRPLGLGHAEALMPALRQLLAPAGGPRAPVRAIIGETGPGSFTGLRIGLAAAEALALAWGGIPVLGIRSTLLVAAAVRRAGEQQRLRVALAAPRGQHWIEDFAAGGLLSEAPPRALANGLVVPGGTLLAGTAVPEAGRAAGVGAPSLAVACGVALHLLGAAVPLYVRAHAADE